MSKPFCIRQHLTSKFKERSESSTATYAIERECVWTAHLYTIIKNATQVETCVASKTIQLLNLLVVVPLYPQTMPRIPSDQYVLFPKATLNIYGAHSYSLE